MSYESPTNIKYTQYLSNMQQKLMSKSLIEIKQIWTKYYKPDSRFVLGKSQRSNIFNLNQLNYYDT